MIVSDRQGRYVSGLRAEDFTLYRDHARQTIAVFDSVEEPLNVVLLLDTSKSTQDVLTKIKDAARNLLKELRPQDRALIIAFDSDVHVLCQLSSDRKALERAIKNAGVGEFVGTTMRDAVSKVLGESFKQIKGRKAIILLTDGKDHGSAISEDALLESAAESADSRGCSLRCSSPIAAELPFESERVIGIGSDSTSFSRPHVRRFQCNKFSVLWRNKAGGCTSRRPYSTLLQSTKKPHSYRVPFHPRYGTRSV